MGHIIRKRRERRNPVTNQIEEIDETVEEFPVIVETELSKEEKNVILESSLEKTDDPEVFIAEDGEVLIETISAKKGRPKKIKKD